MNIDKEESILVWLFLAIVVSVVGFGIFNYVHHVFEVLNIKLSDALNGI